MSIEFRTNEAVFIRVTHAVPVPCYDCADGLMTVPEGVITLTLHPRCDRCRVLDKATRGGHFLTPEEARLI